MKKQVIFKRGNSFYITSEKNYNAYVQDAWAIHKINDCNTLEDAKEFIKMCCQIYQDNPENYKIIL